MTTTEDVWKGAYQFLCALRDMASDHQGHVDIRDKIIDRLDSLRVDHGDKAIDDLSDMVFTKFNEEEALASS